jgi:nicotinamidase-related amidase
VLRVHAGSVFFNWIVPSRLCTKTTDTNTGIRQQPHQVAGSTGYGDSSNTFANRIGWGIRPALLLVDVCTAYFTPGSPLDTTSNPGSAAAPDVMRRLLSTARNTRVPVIWTKTAYKSSSREAGLYALKVPALSMWEKADDSDDLNVWLPGLQPLDSEDVVTKTHPSAFFGTTLSSRLRFAGVDTLILCGASTSGAVRATTMDAMCENYRPMVSDKRLALHFLLGSYAMYNATDAVR